MSDPLRLTPQNHSGQGMGPEENSHATENNFFSYTEEMHDNTLWLIFLAIGFFLFIGLLLTSIILATKKALVPNRLCQIVINETPELQRDVKGGQTLLAALTSEGINVPSPCGGKATCKQCKVQVVVGGGEPLETEKATFSRQQLKAGWRLSCQCKIKEDLKILIPEHLLSLKEFSGEVISNQNVATFIKELVVKLPPEVKLAYRPGDYLQFHVPPFKTNTLDWKKTMDELYFEDWERFKLFDRTLDFTDLDQEVIRAYSMASYPAEEGVVKFTIRIATPPIVKGEVNPSLPWGVCSSYAFSLKAGDTIKLSGPFGESHMIDDERELVFLIGGAGSSFGRSHIMDLFKAKATQRAVTLWYGARSLKERIYDDEFLDLQEKYPNFRYRLVLSEPTQEDLKTGWPHDDPLKTNYLFRAFEKGQLSQMEEPEKALYFVCGPPLHNKSVMQLLDNYGVPRENIVLDDFGS